MNRYKNLFEKICSFENLHLAYLKARKCKRYRNNVLQFSYNLERNLLILQSKLLNQSYQHGSYCSFVICDSKKRQIKAPPFPDRVVHHALCNIIEPLFDKSFIYDSFACRKSKGTHKGIKRLEKFLKSLNINLQKKEYSDFSSIYCLKCDISKYFDSIDQKILFGLLKKRISEVRSLQLIKIIIESNNKETGTGIPIGNLTSQLFANIYLNELDQFIKHKLRIKYYIRYMDDFLILNKDKKQLFQIKEKIKQFLENKLKLKLHPKKANIFPLNNKGIDFLGYQIFGTHRLLRKSTVKRFIKKTKPYHRFQSLRSWTAYARFANSWGLRKKLCDNWGYYIN